MLWSQLKNITNKIIPLHYCTWNDSQLTWIDRPQRILSWTNLKVIIEGCGGGRGGGGIVLWAKTSLLATMFSPGRSRELESLLYVKSFLDSLIDLLKRSIKMMMVSECLVWIILWVWYLPLMLDTQFILFCFHTH